MADVSRRTLLASLLSLPVAVRFRPVARPLPMWGDGPIVVDSSNARSWYVLRSPASPPTVRWDAQGWITTGTVG